MRDTLQQNASKKTDILPARFDTVTKLVVQRHPEAFVKELLGIEDADFLEVVETTQLTMKAHHADSFVLVTIRGRKTIVHCEFQTHDSTHIPIEFRMAGYACRGIGLYGLPILSHVVYLHPRAGKKDPGEYHQKIPGHEIRVQYKVIRLSEMEGQALLDLNQAGLFPFAALMKPGAGMDKEQWLRHCVKTVDVALPDAASKGECLAELGVLGGLILNAETLRKIILEETMHESSIVQYFTEKAVQQGIEQGIERGIQQGIERGIQQGIERGIQQGKRETALGALLDVLEVRFHPRGVQTLKPALEAIDDSQRLRQLHREAIQVPTLEEFAANLVSSGNGTS